MMPVLSNIMSYRPKRKIKPLRPPFQIRHLQNEPLSPHPYASPPIIDINDGSALANPNGEPEGDRDANGKRLPESLQMKLDLEFTDEPLFPPNFLKSDSPLSSRRATGLAAPGGGYEDRNLGINGTAGDVQEGDTSVDEEDEGDEEEDDEASSSEAVIANLEAMDATAFINVIGADNYDLNPFPVSWRKLPPAPIRIPSYGHKTQVSRSRDPSRPTSQISSPDSSAISGTTLARALMANSFVLSADSRGSRYLSGVSLARADSATLPRGEFTLLHSPYWRERTSGGEFSLSPAVHSPPVPPVPDNAELVYVPPKAARLTSESRSKPRESVPGKAQSERVSGSGMISRNGDECRVPPVPENPAITSPNPDRNVLEEEASGGIDLPRLPVLVPIDPPESRRASLVKRESLEPTASPAISETPSSARDIDNVLDYYSLDENSPEAPFQGFRPIFSPIREETSSQLSPNSPYRRDGKTPSTGKSHFVATPSPFSAGVRVEWTPTHQRRGSDPRNSQSPRDGTVKSLLPIGERPRSVQVSPSTPALSSRLPHPQPTLILKSLANSDSELDLVPPPISTMFHRQRSGSIPSPIQVVRDVHDSNTYNITVTDVADDSMTTTPSTGESNDKQTFPETPSAFSPVITPVSAPSPGAAPYTSMSASFMQKAGAGAIQPSLAQQVLLTRAATSVHGARPHKRQSSRANRSMELSQPKIAAIVAERPSTDGNADEVTPTDSSENTDVSINMAAKSSTDQIPALMMESVASVGVTPATPSTTPRPSIEETPPAQQSPANSNVSLFQQPTTSLEQVILLPPSTPLGPRSPPSSRSLGSSSRSESPSEFTESPSTRPKGLPRIPPSPKMLPPIPPQQARPTRPTADGTSSVTPSGSSNSSSAVSSPSSPERLPFRRPDQFDPIVVPVTGSETQAQPSFGQLLTSPSLDPHTSSSPAYSYASPHASIGSPPPYHTVFSPAAEVLTPSTSGTSGSHDPNHTKLQPYSASPHTTEFNKSDTTLSSPNYRQSRGTRNRPSRPPLPAGPRRPSQSNTALPLSTLRNRGGSVSSVVSNLPSSSSRRLNGNGTSSIKFRTPPPKWKGFTLDAARWTFSSSQLQGIVSRAIKQSAESSSIRLLRLETLDGEIQPEMERLEMQRGDVQLKYKTLARRRANLLEVLSTHVDSSDEGSVVALRLVEDLREVSASLDRLTEDLHSTDEQIAQLSQLCLVHSSSALSMALRKLNNSFLRQFTEVQILRSQVESLEAERDEAWKQAEEVAIEYDELRGDMGDNAHMEKRSSRVLASRKSSIRASKAGLRPPSRRHSQRSSVSSNKAYGSYSPSSSRTPHEGIPPVPPIPRRRPAHIMTDIPVRNSFGLSLSTSGPTPNSEMRALARAQEDLYEMLGISVDEPRLRRPRSAGYRPEQLLFIPSALNSHSPALSSGRRASLPGSAQPAMRNSLTADVSIMLTAGQDGWV